MNFNEFLTSAWNDHGDDPDGVMKRFPEGIALIEQADQLAALSNLITHVSGEHLGQWGEGRNLLAKLCRHDLYDPASPASKQIHLSKATLYYASGDLSDYEAELDKSRVEGEHEHSGRVRALAGAAGAFTGQKRTAEAIATFNEALELAAYDPGSDDPAARALATTGNNLALELEELAERTAEETTLMKLAAATARTYWERAGTWINVKIAEVRLAITHLKAGEPDVALVHARRALELCDTNDAGDDQRFYPWLAEARAHHASQDADAARDAIGKAASALEVMDEQMRSYSEPDLRTLRSELSL